MTLTSKQRTTDEMLYQAVGEFFITFSHLISITEHLTAQLISKDGGSGAYDRASIAVSSLAAKSLASTFFSVLTESGMAHWSATDQEILRRIRSEFESLAEQRNRFAHDIWHLGHPNLPRPSDESWHRIRTVGSPTAGRVVKFDVITLDLIRDLIDQIKRVDANIRMISIAGFSGTDFRPELHMEVIVADSGEKYVACIPRDGNG